MSFSWFLAPEQWSKQRGRKEGVTPASAGAAASYRHREAMAPSSDSVPLTAERVLMEIRHTGHHWQTTEGLLCSAVPCFCAEQSTSLVVGVQPRNLEWPCRLSRQWQHATPLWTWSTAGKVVDCRSGMRAFAAATASSRFSEIESSTQSVRDTGVAVLSVMAKH